MIGFQYVASLTGRFKNTVLFSSQIDFGIYLEICQLQDKDFCVFEIICTSSSNLDIRFSHTYASIV